MPNRVLRDWTRSEKMNNVSPHAERWFTRLIMVVDDYGRFYADPRLLKASMFPLSLDNIRDADMLRWMAECQKAGLIAVYENNSKKYLQIFEFGQRLRIKKQKFPQPDDSNLLTDVSHMSDTRPSNGGLKRNETETEVETKLFAIEQCVVIALKDQRWIRANKTNEAELKEFVALLERRGVYEKNPADFKQHFGNWKLSGKSEESLSVTKEKAPDFKLEQGETLMKKVYGQGKN